MNIDRATIFRDLIKIIQEDFYRRLLSGKVREAKASANYLKKALFDLQARLETVGNEISETDPARKKFVTLLQRFYELSSKWQNLVEKELSNVSEKEYQEDPATWNALFQETFAEPTAILLHTLHDLETLREGFEQGKQMLSLKPLYAKEYQKRKSRVDVYAYNNRLVKEAEGKVVDHLTRRDFSNAKVTGKIKTGRWAGYLHTHLAAPLNDHRLVYSWDGKKLIFRTIGTHKELGID